MTDVRVRLVCESSIADPNATDPHCTVSLDRAETRPLDLAQPPTSAAMRS